MIKQKSILKKIIDATKKAFLCLLIFSVCVNIFMLTVPIYMLQLYDYVLSSHSVESLIYLTIIAIFVLVAFALLDITRSRVMVIISGWIDTHMSPRALAKSADALLQGQNYGGQALRDIATIRNFIGYPGVFALFDAPWVPIYIIVIFLLHPVLGVLATFGSLILFSLAIFNEITTREFVREVNNRSIDSQRHVDLSLQNSEVIQAMGMMPAIIDHWHKKNSPIRQLQHLASNRSGTFSSLSKSIRLVLQILMLGMGAYLVIKNTLTPGAMIAGGILLSRALAPVEQSISVWKQLQSSRQAYKRLKAYFNTNIERNSTIQLPKPQGFINLKKVYYGVPQLHEYIIKNVTMSLHPGEMIAMIGPSGAGKSTIARLMVGVWKATVGSVRLDGADVYTWERTDFGLHVGYLPQNVQLFSGTVKDNIARLGEINDEEIVKAAQLAGAHELILKFPSGYDTQINMGKVKLSGGQEQRIALARAVYKNPQVIVLDEPNAHLDTEGEITLINTLLHLKQQGKTIFLISHRSSILKHVDKIALLAEGTIKLLGPRDEILAKLQELAQPQSAAQSQKWVQ